MRLAQICTLPLLVAFTLTNLSAAVGLAWSAHLAVQSHDTLLAAGSLWLALSFGAAGWLCGGLTGRVFSDIVSR